LASSPGRQRYLYRIRISELRPVGHGVAMKETTTSPGSYVKAIGHEGWLATRTLVNNEEKIMHMGEIVRDDKIPKIPGGSSLKRP